MEENTGIMIKLTATNYSIWKPKMEDILYYKDLYDPVEKGEAKPDNITADDWKKNGPEGHWINTVFHHVATETDAHILWKN